MSRIDRRIVPELRATMQAAIDLSFYEQTQLGDDEIVQRERIRQAAAAHDAEMERERQRRMRNFRFKAGML